MLQITINDSDISSSLISYTREKDLCSSEGVVEFFLDSHQSISTYSIIRVYENSVLKGTFYTEFTEKMSDGTMSVHGRDNSKRANDYYIAEEFTAQGDTTSRYWIEFFLGMAGITYNFTVEGSGYTIQDGEVMGLTSCAEIVETLVRYSGWYIFYDALNVAQIGKLQYNSTLYKKEFTDTDIIDVQHIKNDQYLRNRAVVWGAGYRGSDEWTFADISVSTPWDYDSNDKRTILARAGFPVPFSQAIATANVLLTEYSRITEEKTISVVGYHDLEIGEFVLINSDYYAGVGLISAINASADDSGGYVTTLVLDRRCPRFVGFYDVGGIVYAGTEGDGVWTKPLNGPHTWTDYSTGLTNATVIDLDVSYGIASCTTSDGNLHVRTVGDSTWYPVNPGTHYTESGELASMGSYVASNINDLDQTIYGLWVYPASGEYRTWVDSFHGTTRVSSELVTVSGQNYYIGTDIESNYDDIYIAADRGQDVIFRNNSWNQYMTTDVIYTNFSDMGELPGMAVPRFSDRYYLYAGSKRVDLDDFSIQNAGTLPNEYVIDPIILMEDQILIGSETSGGQANLGYVDWNNPTAGFVQTNLESDFVRSGYLYQTLYEKGSPVATQIGDVRILTFVDREQVGSGGTGRNILYFRCVNTSTGEVKTITVDDIEPSYNRYYFSIDGPAHFNFLPLFASGEFVYCVVGIYNINFARFSDTVFLKINPNSGTIVSKTTVPRISEQYNLYGIYPGDVAGDDAHNIFCDEEESVYFVGKNYIGPSWQPDAIFKFDFRTNTSEFIYQIATPLLQHQYALFTISGKPYLIAYYISESDECRIISLQQKIELSSFTLPIYSERSVLRYGTGYLGMGLVWMFHFKGLYSYSLEAYTLGGSKVYDFDLPIDFTIYKTSFNTSGVRDSLNQINKFVIAMGTNRYLIEFNSGIHASGRRGEVIRRKDGEFSRVFKGGSYLNLDISTPNVITTYMQVSHSGIIYLEGEPHHTGRSVGNLWYSPIGDLGTFRLLRLSSMSGSYVHDTRSFTMLSGEDFRTCIGFVVLSGLFGGVGQFSYIDVSEYEAMGGVIVFPDIHTVETFNSVPVALETSNYNYMNTPYFLVGLSGVENPFLQRDYDSEVFINRSTGFPESRITTIRLDEMI